MLAQTQWQADADGVSDPSDWLDTSHAFLKDLDASLRCEICSDIFRAPVSIKTCSHVFCSRCIRDYINQPAAPGAPTDRPCPNCRQPKVYDSELVPIPPLEIAAEAWRTARSRLVQKEEEERSRLASSSEIQASIPQSPSSPASVSAPLKKRRLNEAESLPGSNRDSSSRRVTRSSLSRPSRQSTPHHEEGDGEKDDVIVVGDDTDDDDTWTPDSETIKPNGNRGARSPTKAATSRAKDLKDITASDVVECPLCSYTFTLQALNRHLDKAGACQGPDGPPPSDKERGITSTVGSQAGNFGGWFSRGSKGSSSNSSKANGLHHSSNSTVKLKRPQYQMLSEKALRKLCEDAGLAHNGSKATLEARHRRWIDAFNANLDASPAYRKTEGQLKRDMREWDREKEREEVSAASRAAKSTNANSTKGATTVGASEEERRAYAASHADHFRALVAQSRLSHVKNKEAHTSEQMDRCADGLNDDDAAPAEQ